MSLESHSTTRILDATAADQVSNSTQSGQSVSMGEIPIPSPAGSATSASDKDSVMTKPAEPTRKKMRKSVGLRDHFVPDSIRTDKQKCRHCSTPYSKHSSTSTLLYHLKQRHPALWRELQMNSGNDLGIPDCFSPASSSEFGKKKSFGQAEAERMNVDSIHGFCELSIQVSRQQGISSTVGLSL